MLFRPRPTESPAVKEKLTKPLVIVIPGITSHYRNVRTLQGELAKYGDVEGHVWNSIISPDRPQPERFRVIAEKIHRALNDNRNVLLVGHSLGGAEVVQSLLTLKKQDHDFQQRDLSKLEIVLASPIGMFEGITGTASLFRDFSRLMDSMKPESPFQAFDSLVTFPVRGADPEALGAFLRGAYPELSQLQQAENSPFIRQAWNESDRQYWKNLDPAHHAELSAIDRSIIALLRSPQSETALTEFRQLLQKRNALLYPYQQKLYAGEYYPEPEPETQEFNPGLMAISLLGFLPAVKTLLLGRFPRFLKELSRRGATVRFLAPEFDSFVPITSLLELFAETEITVLEQRTHTDFVSQPTAPLAEALRRLGVSKT